MRVKRLIEQLQAAYGPDDEIAVAYWDRETVAIFADEPGLTEDQWSRVVANYEDGEFGWQEYAAEAFTALLVEVLEEDERREGSGG